jgi:hypothetical protein
MKKPSNFRLSEEALRILIVISEHKGIGRTAVLELIIREYAAQSKLDKGEVQQ